MSSPKRNEKMSKLIPMFRPRVENHVVLVLGSNVPSDPKSSLYNLDDLSRSLIIAFGLFIIRASNIVKKFG